MVVAFIVWCAPEGPTPEKRKKGQKTLKGVLASKGGELCELSDQLRGPSHPGQRRSNRFISKVEKKGNNLEGARKGLCALVPIGHSLERSEHSLATFDSVKRTTGTEVQGG